MCLSNIERVQKEGAEALLSSGWEKGKVDALTQCLMDFTEQAFFDEMYKDAKVELYDDKEDQTLNIVWKTDHLNVRVELCENYEAYWDLFAGKIANGVEVERESSGFGGDGRFGEYNDQELEEDNKWAFHFYWWLEDHLNP